MKKYFSISIISIFNIIFILNSFLLAKSNIDISLQKEIEHSVITGLKWLYDQQEEDGSWQHYPAMSALVLSSFLRSHPNVSPDDTVIAKGLKYLESCIQKDGGIYIDDMRTYNTAICLMAFKDANQMLYSDVISNAQKFLIGSQYSEKNGHKTDSLYFGGVSYGGTDKNPDLSNLQWTLEALRDDDIMTDRVNAVVDNDLNAGKSLFFKNAIKFLERVQNYKKTNDQSYSADDGGFMYRPGESKAGGTRSYGGMTYAGLKSFIYAGLSKDDHRVQAAVNWIRQNFVVSENPGLGEQGLYYFYHTMAKALNVYREETIVDSDGKNHKWRNELADQILKLQNSDGFWINTNGRWWENNPVLVTAYCILALEEIAGLPDSMSRKSLLIK